MIVLFLLHLVFQLISGMTTIYPMAEHASAHQLARYSIQHTYSTEYAFAPFCGRSRSILTYFPKSRAVGSAGSASLLVHMAERIGNGSWLWNRPSLARKSQSTGSALVRR